MRYLVIGLGTYGRNLAINLTLLGNEVIGVDNKQNNLEAVKDKLSSVYMMDCSEKSSLNMLPLKNIDIAIVAIGEDFRSSLRAVALLKEGGVKRIFARAIDDPHQSILEAFSIDRILTPEKRAAEDLSNELNFHSQVTSLSVTPEYLVSKLEVPKKFVGFPYRNFNLARFGLILISATRKKVSKNLLGLVTEEEILLDIERKAQEETAEVGDCIVVVGTKENFIDFAKKVADETTVFSV